MANPVVEAIWDQDVDRLKRQLARGADPNSSFDGKPAVIWATEAGGINSLVALLDAGADVNAADEEGSSALFHASFDGNLAIASALLERGASLSLRNSDGETPLMNAAKAGATEVIQLLLGHGADVNAEDGDGQTALTWAASRGDYPDAVASLLDAGAHIDHVWKRTGWNALMGAIAMQHFQTAKLLIARGAS